MYGALDISTSGLIAQRTRLDVIASNIANKDSLFDSNGVLSPYRRRAAMFATGDPSAHTADGRRLGVHVAAIEVDRSPLERKHDPGNPFADAEGYVWVSNINPAIEQINAMEAARAYEANLAAAEVTKAMMAQALRLIA
ncbi:MAG TPA: flagellar basal body rod protein FlgC [Phycisphaerales bacterium]|nr:flagellar basal body rod protein FlgC [Phycisphaerales bacterium]